MYIYLLTYCELKLLHDHSNILHNAHYACLTSTTSLPCGIQAGHSRVQLQGSTRSRTALYLSNDCLLVAEVGRRDVCDQLMHGHMCLRLPRTRTQFNDRSFAVAGPQVWTWTLPAPLHDTNSIYSFKKYFV